ncbi:transmembrane protein adipocyte-associated 1 [Anaeramoeba flamelloides]|uniref:Transmembrane protein adipocyte-associated 1 n=1 Tax=Anaeramoeba flamelloides TaxID=1746091 RepID=A0ABQ8XT80_9EUKA|nr:transmembrane protein adipocyte-associated 1 [Anaeramoeba flamelloides]
MISGILLTSEPFQLNFCESIVKKKSGIHLYALVTCIINLLFLFFLLFRLKKHRFVIKNSTGFSLLYLYTLLYLITILSFVNVLLEAFGLLKKDFLAQVAFLISHLILFFCELTILISLMSVNHINVLRQSIKRTFVVIMVLFVAELIINFGFKIPIWHYEKTNSAIIFWFVVDTSFLLTYIVVLVLSNLPSLAHKFPLKEEFYRYTTLLLSIKLSFVTGNLFLFFATKIGYW